MLIELTVMLLVLAIVSALCLQAFVWSDSASAENNLRTEAMVHTQNAAQVLKHCNGDFSDAAGLHGGIWNGQQWVIESDNFTLHAEPVPSGTAYLGMARIEAVCGEKVLASLTVCWQEEGHEK